MDIYAKNKEKNNNEKFFQLANYLVAVVYN